MPIDLPGRACQMARILAGACALGVGVVSSTSAAQCETVAEFFAGKQMRFIIRSAPGGGYDLYSRLIGAHIVRHLPGNPSMIPQNMPGAGGITAANYMAEVAPKDGTHLSMVSDALPLDQALGLTPSFKADLRTFGWIGNLGDSNLLTYTFHTSPTKTMADARARPTRIGATGAGSPTTWLPVLFNRVLATRFDLIQGYKSSGDVKLAMERGEVEGYSGHPWSALMSAMPDMVQDKKVVILAQLGLAREKELPDVPLVSELATDADGKIIMEFISKAFAVGRPIATTPGVPPDRLVAIRKAFDDTVADPVFIAAAEKAKAEVKPVRGVVIEALIGEIIGAPQSTRDKVKAVLPDRS